MTHEEGVTLVDQAIAVLMEHCDNVQIIASWGDARDTRYLSRGAGNWFARVGQAECWLNECKNTELAEAVGSAIDNDDKDGEEWKA